MEYQRIILYTDVPKGDEVYLKEDDFEFIKSTIEGLIHQRKIINKQKGGKKQ